MLGSIVLPLVVALALLLGLLAWVRYQNMSPEARERYREEWAERLRRRSILMPLSLGLAVLGVLVFLLGKGLLLMGGMAWNWLTSPCDELLHEEEVSGILGRPVGDVDVSVSEYSCWIRVSTAGHGVERSPLVDVSASPTGHEYYGAFVLETTSRPHAIEGFGTEAWYFMDGRTIALRHPAGILEVSARADSVTRAQIEALARLLAGRWDIVRKVTGSKLE